MLNFFIEVLATWRICSLLISEDCPFEVCARFRDEIGISYDAQSQPIASNEFAKLFTCIWCLSFWVGLILARGDVKRALALSAGAILLNRWIK